MLNAEQLKQLVVDAIEDVKGTDIKVLDVIDKSSVTDVMVIATGNTSRQVKAISDNIIEKAKQAGVRPLGTEGEQHAEWILIDLGDVVAHIMQPAIRDFYNLEKLWGEESPAAAEK
jgi:ribosome-associated protein